MLEKGKIFAQGYWPISMETTLASLRLNRGGFQFELVVANQRVARQDQLILALNPGCNRRLG